MSRLVKERLSGQSPGQTCVLPGVVPEAELERLLIATSTLMHVDAEARMSTYENAEGVKQSRLNLTQSV